jgi:hypothetical protein
MKTNKNQDNKNDKFNLLNQWINKIGIAAILSAVIAVGVYVGISKFKI